MHPTAYELGRGLFAAYWRTDFHRILDVGALNVNGTLRDFRPEAAEYVGIDLQPGDGVDMVLTDPYHYPFPDGHFDMVVSTSCFEHDPMFWLSFLECCRMLPEGGILYINAPSAGSYHRHPMDHWRFYPDAAVALELWGRRMLQPIRCVESFMMTEGGWLDNVMIFTKGAFVPKRYLFESFTTAAHVRRTVGASAGPAGA